MGLKKPKNQSRDHEHHFNCAYAKGEKNNSIEYMLLEKLLNISLFMNPCMQLLTICSYTIEKGEIIHNQFHIPFTRIYEIKIKYTVERENENSIHLNHTVY